MHFDFTFELPRPLMPNMVMIGATVSLKLKLLSQMSLYSVLNRIILVTAPVAQW